MEIRGIFFDLVGTILEFKDPKQSGERWAFSLFEALLPHNLKIPFNEFRELLKNFFGPAYLQTANPSLTIYGRRILTLITNLGLSVTDGQIKKIAEKTVNDWGDTLYVPPETRAILKICSQRYPPALITNFDHPIT